VAAFGEFVSDVHTGAYPEPRHIVGTDPAELEAFRRALALEGD
jgi:3-methyl-2-oxobutanoate hydroxymethyltransferase